MQFWMNYYRMNKDLANLKVLVTRPAHQAEPLCEAIAALGGLPVRLPLLAIEPLTPDARLRTQIQQLDNFNILIFISTNAAVFGAALIDQYWPQFPVGIEVLAIGPTTASTLNEQLDCAAQTSANGMDSEAVLGLDVLNKVDGKRIGIFRGQGGRELLADTLRGRGAQVDYLEVYRRSPVQHDAQEFARLINTDGVDLITVTSSESLRLIEQLAGDNTARLSLIPLLVPSARIAEQASAAGFSTVLDAGGANQASMIAALQNYAAGADNKA